MDQIIHDANSEITNLREKIKCECQRLCYCGSKNTDVNEAMQLEQKSLEQKCDKLYESCREKEKSKNTIQQMYTKLKQQHQAAGMEIAADHDADNVLEAAHYNHANDLNGQHTTARANSNGSRRSGGRPNATNLWQNRVEGSRAGLQSARESHRFFAYQPVSNTC